MNLRPSLYLLCLLLIGGAVPQNSIAQYQLVRSYPVSQPLLLAADPTGNAYVATGNELLMYNRKDTLYRRFSNMQLGLLTSIDASNPMKILLYFRDQGRILFLDNNISEFMQPVYLESYGLEQSTLACSSYDNGFWLYSPTRFALVRFDQYMQQTTEISNIQQLIHAAEIDPVQMQESSNRIYLNDPALGIMIFDVFGGYVRTLPITGIAFFQVVEGKLIYAQEDGLYLYDLVSMETEKWAWPEKKIPMSAVVTYDKLYLLQEGRLLIYRRP